MEDLEHSNTQEGAGASTEQGQPVPTQQAEATGIDEILSRLQDYDPDDLVRRLPKLQGKIGQLAQAQATQLTARQRVQWEQEQAARAAAEAEKQRREQWRDLATNDPDKLAELVTGHLAETEYQELNNAQIKAVQDRMAAELTRQFNAVYERPIIKEIWEQADPATKEKLNWQRYQSLDEFTEAVADVVADYRAEKLSETKAKSKAEAMTRDSAANRIRNDAETEASIGVDGLGPGGILWTEEAIQKLIATEGVEGFRKHEKVITEQYRRGLIK